MIRCWLPRFELSEFTLCLNDGEVEGPMLYVHWRAWTFQIGLGRHNGRFRYLRISITQPAEGEPLTAGVVMAGRAFSSALNHEWGAGRRPIDTSAVTPLPAGGFSVVEGARKSSWSWSFGDLSDAELDALYEITLYRGEGKPVLVVEDPAQSAGLRRRIHYGLFRQLRAYERLSKGRTRWEMTIEDWGAEEASAL